MFAVGGDELRRQLLGHLDLSDERMRQQRGRDPVDSAVQGGLQGEFLVRRHMGDESGEERLYGRDGQGSRSLPVDAGGHLDDGVVGEEGQRAVVADVGDADVTGVGGEGVHQLYGGLG